MHVSTSASYFGCCTIAEGTAMVHTQFLKASLHPQSALRHHSATAIWLLGPSCIRPESLLQASQHYHVQSTTLRSDQQSVKVEGVAKQPPSDLRLTIARLPGYGWKASGFPFEDAFSDSTGQSFSSEQVLTLMTRTATDERLNRIREVVGGRTFSILPVIEGLYDQGNIGAVCRSADALGYGAVHVINNRTTPMKQSRGRNSAGAEKWLDMQVWSSTKACIEALKADGFRVVTTALQPQAVPITRLDWTRPTAFIMGNEAEGVSQEAIDLADDVAIIPMQGCMVDSFNVAVAAALTMWEARSQRQRLLGRHADLTAAQRQTLLALMLLRNKGRVKQGPLVSAGKPA